MKFILLAVVLLLAFGCTSTPQFGSTAASGGPTAFGNGTRITAYVGGSEGIGNFTGRLLGQNLTLNGTSCTSGQFLTSNSSGVGCTTLNTTGVTAATYGGAAVSATIGVDINGRIVSAANTSIAIAGTAITSGTITDTRLSANVTRNNATNIFTVAQNFTSNTYLYNSTNPYNTSIFTYWNATCQITVTATGRMELC